MNAPTTSPPVLAVHGWGGSYESTWVASGFTALLEDAGRRPIGVDLLGHGQAPKPHDVAAYGDLTERLFAALPDEPVDAIGFSLGGMTLLRAASTHPQRFSRLIIAGVGRNAFDRDTASSAALVAALRGELPADAAAENAVLRAFLGYAHSPGNDPLALAAAMEAPKPPITAESLAAITCPVLVAIGDRDFTMPADALIEALPAARLQVLRGVDHFATPHSFAFIDAALSFLDAEG